MAAAPKSSIRRNTTTAPRFIDGLTRHKRIRQIFETAVVNSSSSRRRRRRMMMIQQKRVLARRLQQRHDSRMYRPRHRCDENSDSRNSHCKARRERQRQREGRRSRGTEETGKRVVGYRGRAYNRTGRQEMACTVISWKSTGMSCDWLEENGDVL